MLTSLLTIKKLKPTVTDFRTSKATSMLQAPQHVPIQKNFERKKMKQDFQNLKTPDDVKRVGTCSEGSTTHLLIEKMKIPFSLRMTGKKSKLLTKQKFRSSSTLPVVGKLFKTKNDGRPKPKWESTTKLYSAFQYRRFQCNAQSKAHPRSTRGSFFKSNATGWTSSEEPAFLRAEKVCSALLWFLLALMRIVRQCSSKVASTGALSSDQSEAVVEKKKRENRECSSAHCWLQCSTRLKCAIAISIVPTKLPGFKRAWIFQQYTHSFIS